MYEPEIQTISLTPSMGGRFEVTVDDQLLFSKMKEQRKAYPDEIEKLVGNFLKGG